MKLRGPARRIIGALKLDWERGRLRGGCQRSISESGKCLQSYSQADKAGVNPETLFFPNFWLNQKNSSFFEALLWTNCLWNINFEPIPTTFTAFSALACCSMYLLAYHIVLLLFFRRLTPNSMTRVARANYKRNSTLISRNWRVWRRVWAAEEGGV